MIAGEPGRSKPSSRSPLQQGSTSYLTPEPAAPPFPDSRVQRALGLMLHETGPWRLPIPDDVAARQHQGPRSISPASNNNNNKGQQQQSGSLSRRLPQLTSWPEMQGPSCQHVASHPPSFGAVICVSVTSGHVLLVYIISFDIPPSINILLLIITQTTQ